MRNLQESVNKTRLMLTPEEPDHKRHIIRMWKIYAGVIVAFFLLFIGVSQGLLGALPTFIELESPKSSLASEVYASDGVLLGKFYLVDRSNVTYEQIPPHTINALVATEDARFYQHSGIDFRGMMRVILKTVIGGMDSGGGSTITQQLAKNLFHDRPKSTLSRIGQKLKEWVIAVKLERSYTKEEILAMYFNTVPFGNNAYGIKSAAQTYFNCPPDSLKMHQGAMLVGMLKGTTRYNPRRNPNNALERRNVVLQQMYRYGKISSMQRDSISKLGLDIKFSPMTHDEGLATYFREYIKAEVKDWATKNVKVDGTNFDIYRDGLKIYTTLNSKIQQYAEEAVNEHMPDLQKQFYDHWKGHTPWESLPNAKVPKGDLWEGTNELIYRAVKNSERYLTMKDQKIPEQDIKKAFTTPYPMTVFSWKNPDNGIDTIMSPLDSIKYTKFLLHTGMVVMDPETGHVLAWVGGIKHKFFKYDSARPSSKRQVGSTFKPFVYAVALQNGWSPCSKVPNLPITFENYDNWSPENAGTYLNGQMVSLRTGLAHSINRVAAYLMKQLSPQAVISLARKMGVESHIDEIPSICLGSVDMSVYELVGAYGTFANKGFYTHPICITRIEDKNGNELQSFSTTTVEAMDEATAYAMITMLRGVVDNGTASRLRWKYNITADVAGKTGTTNDNSDGWFVGMTPQMVAGIWVGGDEKTIHFKTTRLGSGTNMAVPIYGKFLNKVYADTTAQISSNARFQIPPQSVMRSIELDCNKYDIPYVGAEDGTSAAAEPDSTAAKTDTTRRTFDYNNQFD